MVCRVGRVSCYEDLVALIAPWDWTRLVHNARLPLAETAPTVRVTTFPEGLTFYLLAVDEGNDRVLVSRPDAWRRRWEDRWQVIAGLEEVAVEGVVRHPLLSRALRKDGRDGRRCDDSALGVPDRGA